MRGAIEGLKEHWQLDAQKPVLEEVSRVTLMRP
mgnify:CR=1 FL=1|jgi:hypothetical protein